MPDNKIAGLADTLLRKGSQILDDQKLQRKVGRLLGVEDERERALSAGKARLRNGSIKCSFNRKICRGSKRRGSNRH